MLFKLSSKSCYLKKKNIKISILRDFNVNSFIFEVVTKKTDFIPTYFKWNTLEFFSLAFQILIPFCYLAFQIAPIGIYVTLKAQAKYKQAYKKTAVMSSVPVSIAKMYTTVKAAWMGLLKTHFIKESKHWGLLLI